MHGPVYDHCSASRASSQDQQCITVVVVVVASCISKSAFQVQLAALKSYVSGGADVGMDGGRAGFSILAKPGIGPCGTPSTWAQEFPAGWLFAKVG